MRAKDWHHFRETTDGNDVCARCETQVTLDAHMTFTLPCPAGDCPSPKNPDRGCYFVAHGTNPARCLFCGRTGDVEPDTFTPFY